MASNNKYDRQIRLWGANGQKILSNSSILVLGASPAASETLKNLILPGIKHFTIVDEGKVTERDLGQNFFFRTDQILHQRAQAMTENLLELNPDDVTGDFKVQSVQDFIQQNDFAKDYQLVLASDLDNNTAIQIEKSLSRRQIPLVLLRQYGQIATLRISLKELCVAEQKPYQKVLQDLRLNMPFVELQEYSKTFDLPSLPLEDHSHVPYVILLVQAIQLYRSKNDGKEPKTFAEKNSFKDFIKSMAKDFGKELNFKEAITNSFMLFQSKDLPQNIQDIFSDPKIEDSSQTSAFWIIASAIKKFFSQTGQLPVAGIVPDMTSKTDYYLGLQNVYQNKAEKDFNEVLELVKQILLERNQNVEAFLQENTEEIKIMCKNSQYLEVTKTKSIEEELANLKNLPEEFADELHDLQENMCCAWYLACRAAEQFRANSGRIAGTPISQETINEQDVQALQNLVDGYCKEITPNIPQLDRRFVKELVRFGDSKLHNVSSFLGGVASQEIIKILIHQYTIMNSTFIYDGIHGAGKVIE